MYPHPYVAAALVQDRHAQLLRDAAARRIAAGFAGPGRRWRKSRESGAGHVQCDNHVLDVVDVTRLPAARRAPEISEALAPEGYEQLSQPRMVTPGRAS